MKKWVWIIIILIILVLAVAIFFILTQDSSIGNLPTNGGEIPSPPQIPN